MITPGWSGGNGTGGGTVTNHNLLLGREDADCHPVNAITGLAAALSSAKYRGAFPSLLALETAYPADVSGAYASVVTAGEAAMYLWNDADQEWQDSGVSGVFVESVNGMTGPNVVLSPSDIGAESTSEKGQPGGYAELGADGRVLISQLPVSGISLNHENCTNRDAPDSHPMGAITGLTNALDDEADARGAADGVLQDNIDDEADAREAADGVLQGNINDEAEARIAADGALNTAVSARQLLANLVAAWQSTPDDTHYPSEKLVKDELDAIRAVEATGLRYKGTLDYGADTVDSMEAIPSPADGALCGVAATNLTYVYDESEGEWVAQAHGTDAMGDLWRMASWYGEWRGQTFTGNATADIVCRDASDPDNPVWDLLVSESTPVDGVTIGSINGKNGVLDGGITMEKLAEAVRRVIDVGPAFFVGEYYFLQVIRPGFVRANGGILTNVSEDYPLLKAWLKDTGPYGGAFLRKTATEWSAEYNDPKWNAPDTSGTREGMSPYYVLDEDADTIQVPYLNGAHIEAAGFDGQAAGKTLVDAIRDILQSTAPSLHVQFLSSYAAQLSPFVRDTTNANRSPILNINDPGAWVWEGVHLDISTKVPTASVVRPRSYTSYLCLYAGPA